MKNEQQNPPFEPPQVVPGFSCLRMKQELQEDLLRRTAAMSVDEFLTYLRDRAATNPLIPVPLHG